MHVLPLPFGLALALVPRREAQKLRRKEEIRRHFRNALCARGRAGAHGPPLLQQRPRARLMRTETFETPGPVRLDVEMPAGEIEIATATTDETHVELESLSSNEQLQEMVAAARIESIRRGDVFHVTVEVRTRHGVWISFRGGPDIQLGTPQMRLRISCPAGAELDVKTKSADLQAHGEYGDVDFKTASGDLSIETARNAHVKTA